MSIGEGTPRENNPGDVTDDEFSSISNVARSDNKSVVKGMKAKRKKQRTMQPEISKRKRKGRLVRLVSIDMENTERDTTTTKNSSNSTTASVPTLPRNQYTTTLRRRAIRKATNNNSSIDIEYGDVSLGMKLIVAGGRVIVRSLTSLNDGLASPAQLAGVVQRGDVLLAIGSLSLANLPVNQLVEGLSPLSKPDSRGFFERYLDLRFEAGAGLGLLAVYEEEHGRSQDSLTSDQVFATSHLEPRQNIKTNRNEKSTKEGSSIEAVANIIDETKDDFQVNHSSISKRKPLYEAIDRFSPNFNSLISTELAKERNFDRERYESEYFNWKNDISDLLALQEYRKNDGEKILTKIERLELGHRIMQITKFLELNLEEIDKGDNTRSQQSWNSGVSIRSGSSTVLKRQYSNNPFTDVIDEQSVDSDYSLDGVDSDKLLLGLAARDLIWRTSVIAALNKATEAIKNVGDNSTDSAASSGTVDFTQHIEFFLFREKSSRNSKKESKSIAFPPREITRILFDIVTYMRTVVHDEITVFTAGSKMSSNILSRRSGTTNTCMSRRALRRDILMAKRFILDEALPRWLQSFHPLKLDQRKVLWPRQSIQTDGRSSDVDSLTHDSEGSRNPTRGAQGKKTRAAGLEIELESETCFLVTYFCTEKVIGNERSGNLGRIDKNTFIETYGAYLQLHTCLSFASFVKDEVAISGIHKVANEDPNHLEAIKEIRNSEEFLFYDLRKLSALLQCLESIRFETNERRRKVLLDLCVSGYPDVQPWQVRKACLCYDPESNEMREYCSIDIMEDLFYTYLCNLLNPIDGHEAARQDSNLLKEFCELSIGIDSRMKNFMNIAAPPSNNFNSYRRDLIMLLDFSSAINNHDLSLDLVDEIIENGELSSNKDAFHCTLNCLRKIGVVSIVHCSDKSKETVAFKRLRRVLHLFEKMSTNNRLIYRNLIIVSDELLTLFEQWKKQNGSGDDRDIYILIDFVINVSSLPVEVMKALMLFISIHKNSIFSRLEGLLCRGIQFAVLNGELSGTLLRLKHARTTFKELGSNFDKKERQAKETLSIWERMGKGNLSVDK